MLWKRLDSLTIDDIDEMKGSLEGQQLEFKSVLTPSRDKDHDPWLDNPAKKGARKGPGERAKYEVYEELVAFANTEGGTLILGMSETNEKPARAKEIVPIPDCEELARRLEQSAADWIDPPIPGIRFRGVPMSADSNDGVVVSIVPRSAIAPHRLYKKNQPFECLKRYGEESKAIRMREIQDIYFDRARGLDWIEREFKSSITFALEFGEHDLRIPPACFQITLVPSSAGLAIERPYTIENLFLRKKSFDAEPATVRTIDHGFDKEPTTIKRPILRGGEVIQIFRYPRRPYDPAGKPYMDGIMVRVMETGSVAITVATTNTSDSLGLALEWIIAEFANGLEIADYARCLGGQPEIPYLAEVRIGGQGYWQEEVETHVGGIQFGLLGFEDRHPTLLSPIPLVLPRQTILGRDMFPEILKRTSDDLYMAVNREPNDDLTVKFTDK